MQAKIEASAVGRALISVLAVCIVFLVLAINLPDSEIKSVLMRNGAAPVLRATGLDQSWGVFSDVRQLSVYVEAHIDYADGTSSETGIPHGTGISALADYRWHKYSEQLRLDDNDRLWKPYATLVAERERADGRAPVRVTLVRRFADTLPPGPGPAREKWTEYAFYTLELGEPR